MQEADRAGRIARADRCDSVHDRSDRRAASVVRGTERNGGVSEEGEGAVEQIGSAARVLSPGPNDWSAAFRLDSVSAAANRNAGVPAGWRGCVSLPRSI